MVVDNKEILAEFPRIWINNNALASISDCHGIVFDIDGVLLDVAGSFRAAISQTVQYYFTHVLAWPGDELLITPDETQLFKMAGGFNNDWDLTDMAVLYYLGKAEADPNIKTLAELRNTAPSVAAFTETVKTSGGGMETAGNIVFEGLKPLAADRVRTLWDRVKIRRIFQELYAGDDYCRRLYGFDAVYHHGPGLLVNEHALIDADLLGPWCGHIGILTGRAQEEAKLAVEVTGLSNWIPDEMILFDDGSLRKPNPEALLALAERLDIKAGVYFGDTADDLATANNLKALNSDVRFSAAVILHREEERGYFRTHGADMMAPDVNSALQLMNRLRRRTEDEQ